MATQRPGASRLFGGTTEIQPAPTIGSAGAVAVGGWLAGALYDHFGYYAPAFATGVSLNALNVTIIGSLVALQRRRAAAIHETSVSSPGLSR